MLAYMEKIHIFNLIERMAPTFGLEASLVYAVCRQESSLNPFAVRYEKNYRWLLPEVKVPGCTSETERMLQKTSIGLMQVMGAVYRELGFTGWLTEVVGDAVIQLEYGCLFLSKKIEKYGMDRGILAYNSGSPIKKNGKYINQYYLDRVKQFRKEWGHI